ncbi:MAG TPA: hypothetical protein PLP75_08925 [Burkholderiales bacterium]|nr:hypothetical protein [Burkholderiales bacterium]
MNQNSLDYICFNELVNSSKLLAQYLATSTSGIINLNLEQIVPAKLANTTQILSAELSVILDNPIIAQSKKTSLAENVSTNVLLVRNLRKESLVIIANYIPIINLSTSNIIGLAESLHVPNAFNLSSVLHQYYKYGKIHCKEENKFFELSEFQKQIIFFFLLKLDSKTIARLMSEDHKKYVSKNLIDKVITKDLLPKFLVCHRNALYDKLYTYGYSNFIPENFISHGLTIRLPNSQIKTI